MTKETIISAGVVLHVYVYGVHVPVTSAGFHSPGCSYKHCLCRIFPSNVTTSDSLLDDRTSAVFNLKVARLTSPASIDQNYWKYPSY